MNIRKLKSGSYQVRQMQDGKTYSVVIPYKPSEKEAFRLIQEKINNKPLNDVSFNDAAIQYINSKRNVLSPRTIREYGLYINRLPAWFIKENIFTLTQYDIQKCINELSVDKSPKTVRCLHGFISAVLGMFRADMVISTTLPQKRLNEPYIPSKDEVVQLLVYTKENYPHFYPAIYLGCLSLRRSEICALELSDLESNNVLRVNKALVEDEHKNWVIKTTKTTKSERDIVLPQDLADYIRENGFIYDGSPQSISNYMKRIQKELKMPQFSLHKTRHYFASRMLDEGYDMKTIEEWGGWAGSETLSRIYQHSLKMKQEEAKKNIANVFKVE